MPGRTKRPERPANRINVLFPVFFKMGFMSGLACCDGRTVLV